MRNEKGSVLSIAIVIIFILSFSVTLTTAYTYNVSQRTSTIVENNDEDLFARTIVRSVVQELKEFIYSYELLPQDYYQFVLEDQIVRDQLTLRYNELIVTYYLSKNIVINEDFLEIVIEETGEFIIGTESYTRKYTVSYSKLNSRITFKELLIELKTVDDFEEIGGVSFINLDDLSNYLLDDFLTEADELDCEGSGCTQAFYDVFYSNSPQNIHGALTANVLIDEDFTLTFTQQGGASTRLNLNSNVMVVRGDLTLTNLHNITGPGLIVVLGDLTITNRHKVEFEDIIILVSGKTTIDYTGIRGSGNRRITGSNYHIVSADTTNGLINVSGGNYYNYIFTDNTGGGPTDYRYIGSSSNFAGFSFILHELDQYIDLGGVGAYTNIFEFIESAFQEG